MSPWRFAGWTLVLAVLTLAAPRRALADGEERRVINLNFQVDLDAGPTHLCVLTRGETDKTLKLTALDELRSPKPAQGSTSWHLDPGVVTDLNAWFRQRAAEATEPREKCQSERKRCDELRATLLDSPRVAPDGKKAPIPQKAVNPAWVDTWAIAAKVQLDSWGDLRDVVARLAPAARGKVAEGDAAAGDACSRGAKSEPDACAPQFDAQADLKDWGMTCAATTQKPNAPYRLVVLSLEFASQNQAVSKAPISALTLDGNSARIQLVTPLRGDDTVSAHVAGGHFARGASRYSTGTRLDLELLPRCRMHELLLPPVAITAKTAVNATMKFVESRIDSSGAGPSTEESTLECRNVKVTRGRFEMKLPYLTGGTTKTVDVTVGDSASFTGSWKETIPPPTLGLRASKISFAWSRNCLYPWPAKDADAATSKEACPSASLPDVGLECGRGTPDLHEETCSYTCPSAPSSSTATIDFDLPTRVRFRRSVGSSHVDESWDDHLTSGGQLLRAYVAQDQRRVEADFSAWGDEGEGISSIAVSGLTGSVYSIPYKHGGGPSAPGSSILVPGVGCSDSMAYRLIGVRDHDTSVVTVRDGKLPFFPPSQTVKHFAGRFTLGAGGMLSFKNHNNQSLDNRTFGVAVATLSARPTGGWWSLDASVGFLLTQQQYFPVFSDSFPRTLASVWFNRYLVGLGASFDVYKNLYLGAGAWLTLGHATLSKEARLVDGVHPGGAPFVLVGFRIVDMFAIEAASRLFYENVAAYDTNFKGPPKLHELMIPRLMFDLGLRFGRH